MIENFTVPDEIIAFAHTLADRASGMALVHFEQGKKIQTEIKEDKTPVTVVDRMIEEMVRASLAQTRPQDSIIGEELPTVKGASEWTWIVDPIDGTRSFAAGEINFGFLLAVHHATHGFVFGLANQPVTSERWVGVADSAPRLLHNGLPVPDAVRDSLRIGITQPVRLPPNLWKALAAQRTQGASLRYGGNFLNFAHIADGRIDLSIEAGQSLYDLAPFVPMFAAMPNGGGRITDVHGKMVGLDWPSKGMVVAAYNADLHQQALELCASLGLGV